jgi:hypothetical protein
MNYGYAPLVDDGKLISNLKEEDEDERFCLQLYHYCATCNAILETNKYTHTHIHIHKELG